VDVFRCDVLLSIKSDAGVVHSTHCVTRGQVAFRRGDRQLEHLDWRQADSVEILSRGYKVDRRQEGVVRARARDEVCGPCSGYKTVPAAVPLP